MFIIVIKKLCLAQCWACPVDYKINLIKPLLAMIPIQCIGSIQETKPTYSSVFVRMKLKLCRQFFFHWPKGNFMILVWSSLRYMVLAMVTDLVFIAEAYIIHHRDTHSPIFPDTHTSSHTHSKQQWKKPESWWVWVFFLFSKKRKSAAEVVVITMVTMTMSTHKQKKTKRWWILTWRVFSYSQMKSQPKKNTDWRTWMVSSSPK